MEELKETSFEQESKINDLEILLEEQKNKSEDDLAQRTKDLKKARESEAELQRKFDQLTKRYETDCTSIKEQQQANDQLRQEKLADLERQNAEKDEAFEMARQQRLKEEAVLKQKLEFAQFQLEEEKKKFIEAKRNHEAMISTIQSTTRESVIGREEA